MGASTRALKPSGFSASAMKPLSLSRCRCGRCYLLVFVLLRTVMPEEARPLFRDHRKFSKMADPLLQGHDPTRGLYQALVIAAMCLQEQAATRPLIGDVVAALTYLASQVHDPNAAAVSRFNRVGPSSPRAREDRKSLGVGLDRQHALRSLFGYSPDLRHTGLFRAPNPGYGSEEPFFLGHPLLPAQDPLVWLG